MDTFDLTALERCKAIMREIHRIGENVFEAETAMNELWVKAETEWEDYRFSFEYPPKGTTTPFPLPPTEESIVPLGKAGKEPFWN